MAALLPDIAADLEAGVLVLSALTADGACCILVPLVVTGVLLSSPYHFCKTATDAVDPPAGESAQEF